MANASSQDLDFLGSPQAPPPAPTGHAFGAARTKLTDAWFDCGRASAQEAIK